MGDIHRFRGTARRDLIDAVLTASGTSLLFILVYGGCSWITAQRSGIGTLVFGWERSIPFIPAMIVPYMSIDLLFVGAPFLCSDIAERRLLAKRLCFVILVAGGFFLLMPLRFAFPRPVPEDWTAPIFRFLHGFDRPYNMFPSLHIALRTLLADTYARHTRGLLRLTVHIWFSLIGLSTVLTWQHHVIDVAGGFTLALLCFYLIRQPFAQSPVCNRRVGLYYITGATICVMAAIGFSTPGVLLLWPAFALYAVGAAYLGVATCPYHKHNGKLPLSSRWLLAPVLSGHRFSLLYYRRRTAPWNEIIPGLWLGRQLDEEEAKHAIDAGVTAVLDLTSEFSEPKTFRALRYLNLPVLDLTAPRRKQLVEAIEFIGNERQEGTVYVHCKIGFSRSAAVVGTYLLRAGITKTADQAIAMMRRARPGLIVRPEARRTIQQEQTRLSSATPGRKRQVTPLPEGATHHDPFPMSQTGTDAGEKMPAP
ncbi:membrane-associated phosphatase, PAP2_like_Aur1 family, and protein serine/threonine/tyrosine phosphatase [Syntrophotalea carbinolica DSM 2380]|uniref:Membrane-associated phosphatase, PAP2_like_Aur1 family, and protein serine/threonine/tyrosine phosphatase n=1 Tax=Syntrophotalea carbinolica (strain DSM 2380 / NBRC 103641 / GraBd1) TaxID=338963 RepID=Q3A0U1_SYNC1|nr:phosphatase PAP2/dual specificity phosphatase family protein [Syntrophotalea carbinolica]ABA90016.1 membrane-associated phosphatase, PAP2_like_Aur1 family, and protein serine/threonine/tyrosine phosphatase [Syntrophotalea carbinolica DSM 2380]